jgi:hypothetical protein
METIALTTAMADARAAIQATLRETRSRRQEFLHRSPEGQGEDISTTLQACEYILGIIQVHLSYLGQPDSLLLVPGTNAENSGTCKYYSKLI